MTARVTAPTADDAARLGAAWVAARACEALAERSRFSVALAGGESPKALYAALRARDDVDWTRWDCFLGDERAVPELDPRSNLRGLRDALLDHVAVDPARVHPMYVAGLSLDAMAERYAHALRDVVGSPAVFDLVILGLGRDAHTLSLHPGCAAIDERERDVVALHSPPMDPDLSRVTLTPPVVARARAVLMIASGASKASAAAAVLDGPDDRRRWPGQIVRDAAGEVVALLDEAAASGLSSDGARAW